MKIRKAKPRDAKEIAKLRRNTFRNVNAKEYTKDHIKYFNSENTKKRLKKE
jgi:hypothetical protein